MGAGLGPSSLSQVLAIQHVVPERQRGVATSLVPFFRTVGGSIGVGALGGVFAAGLAARLGSGMEAASRLLAGPHAAGAASTPPVAPAFFRQAIERSLLPVFAVLLALAAVNLWLTSGFPKDTSRRRPSRNRRLPRSEVILSPRNARCQSLKTHARDPSRSSAGCG